MTPQGGVASPLLANIYMQRGVDFGRETGPGELILDIEYAEAMAAFEHVGDEVEL
jgi:hypothetical protein